jgi:hypothetical protein
MLTRELASLFGTNDRNLTMVENDLIEKINLAYDKALKPAIKEFKELEKMDGGKEADRKAVQKILDKTLAAFREEYSKLIEPIQDATVKAYLDGLAETKDILKILGEGKR